jgi:DNA-binding GntR family transcriptional regulator
MEPLKLIDGARRHGKGEPSLTDKAYAIIRREIITCQMSPGSEVSEQELADRLGMSKTPIREALGRLDREGLVATYPRRGYRIAPITLKDINDLFAIRSVLERTAAVLAAQNMSDEELNTLEEFAVASYTLSEQNSLDHFVDANRSFHSMIAKGSKNPRLYNLLMSHLDESYRFFYIGAKSRDVNVETNRDHIGIVDVLRKRDGVAAGQIMADHIEATRIGLNESILKSAFSSVTF